MSNDEYTFTGIKKSSLRNLAKYKARKEKDGVWMPSMRDIISDLVDKYIDHDKKS